MLSLKSSPSGSKRLKSTQHLKKKIYYSADLAPLEFPEVHQGKMCWYVSGSVRLSAAPLEHGSCWKLTHGWLKLKACRWSSRSSSCLACWNSCLSLRIRSWLLGGISLLQQRETSQQGRGGCGNFPKSACIVVMLELAYFQRCFHSLAVHVYFFRA